MRQKTEDAGQASQAVGGREGHPPPPLQMEPLQNRPDLRTGGAQDSKHTAKLFDVILSWEKGGTRSTVLPQDAAHGPAGTEAKHLRDLTPGTQVSHTSTHTSPCGQDTHKVAYRSPASHSPKLQA